MGRGCVDHALSREPGSTRRSRCRALVGAQPSGRPERRLSDHALDHHPGIQPVLYVCHAREVGGAELYLEGLIEFALAGHLTVEVVCRRDAALDGWAQRIAARGARVHRLDLAGPADVLKLRRLMRAARLVHLVLAYPVGKYQLLAAIIARSAGRPLVITHQLVVDVDEIAMSGAGRAFWRRAFRSYRRLARVNIASSQAGYDLLVRRHGFPADSTRVIYNGGNVSMFVPLDEPGRLPVRAAMAAELAGEPWGAEILLCCTVARLSAQKGLLDLVQAAGVVARAIPGARFVLIGDGELRETLQREIAKRGLERQVLLAGARPLEVLPGWLGCADLFVLSSHHEGMPLSMIEAMAAGCPVVATRVGGVPDVLGESGAGELVPAHDPAGLAAAIERVLRDAGLRDRMRRAARARAVEAFDVRRCYEKTVALYAT